MTTAFDAYSLSLASASNLRLAAPAHALRMAEKAMAAVKADPNHTYAQASDARLAVSDARLALWRASHGVNETVFPDAVRRARMCKVVVVAGKVQPE
jgi:hypothetical protein